MAPLQIIQQQFIQIIFYIYSIKILVYEMNVLNKIKSKKAIIIPPPSQNKTIQDQNEQAKQVKQVRQMKQNTKKQIKQVEEDQKIVIENEKPKQQQKRVNVLLNKFKKNQNHKRQEKNIFNQKKQSQQKPQKYQENHEEKPKIKNRMTQPSLQQEQILQPQQQQVFQTQYQKKKLNGHQNNKQYLKNSKQSQYLNPSFNSNSFENTNYFSYNSHNTSSSIQPQLQPSFQYSFQKELSSTNNFTNIFKTTRNKQSSKEGIYFEENRLMRNQKNRTNSSSQDTQFELSSILKASRSKQSMNKIRKQTTTSQNYLQIQDKLLSNSFNKQVLCLIVKKGYSIGNIHIFQGEIISLKLKRLQSQFLAQNRQIQRLKLKVSCNRKVIFHSENVLRIYLKEIIFLSQTQATFSQKFILQIVQKSQLIKR